MEQLSTLKSHYDVVIVGGGVNGCGIARECAYQGLSVACFDRGDFASGTSSASSKLIHGGLRYLEHGHFSLVREALLERRLLLKNAPHLVRPLPFVIPIFSHSKWSRLKTWLGVKLYDVLCLGKRVSRSRYLSANDVVSYLPYVNKDDLLGGVLYYDAQVDDARLVIELAQQAEQWGADILNYVGVSAISQIKSGNYTITLEDSVTGNTLDVTSRCVVNATGPWSDINGAQWGVGDVATLRPSKGVHIITSKVTVEVGVLGHAPQDGRVFFILPYQGKTLIGTTDTEFRGDISQMVVTESDIVYLLRAANAVLPYASLNISDVEATFCGLRPLLKDDSATMGEVSREEVLIEHSPGFWSLIGGKYTTFRAVSDRIAKKVMDYCGGSSGYRSTRSLVFPGAGIQDSNAFSAYLLQQHSYPSNVDLGVIQKVVARYGSAAPVVLEVCREDTWYFDQFPESDVLIGELLYGIRYEFVRSPLDFFRRRTDMFFDPDHGRESLDIALDLLSRELAWSDDERLYFTREYYEEYKVQESS